MNFGDLKSVAPIPIYLQLYHRIKRDILCGQFQAGGKIPSIREMAAIWQINANTVTRAYRILQQEGFICTARGKGTKIVSNVAFIQKKRKQEAQILCRDYIHTMAALGFTTDEALAFIREYPQWLGRGYDL